VRFDYDTIADSYDDYRTGAGPYLGTLVTLAESASARRVLEVGSGTGNSARAFLERYPCDFIGLDVSWRMLAKAKIKGVANRWVQASAMDLPVADECVDYVFGCYVLHHIEDFERMIRESARVIGSGCAAFVTASHEFIEGYPMNTYFPSFAKIDRARFPSVERVRAALEAAGFRETGIEKRTAPPRIIDRAYADRVAAKFISTYAVMPDDEFEAGLKRLYADLEPEGRLDMRIIREATIIWATK